MCLTHRLISNIFICRTPTGFSTLSRDCSGMTMPDFLLPDLGEGLEEAEIVTWHVKAGDVVQVDQVVAEVETAKAVVEVPIPFAGVVTELHAAPGATIAVGQPLITITTGATGTAADAEEPSGSVLIGYGTASTVPSRRYAARRVPQPAQPASAPNPARAPGRSRRVPVVSPLVRKMATDAGLDLTTVTGTGPSGLVSRADVRVAITQRATVQAPDAVSDIGATGGQRIPLRGLRRATADKLTRSRREIPEATVWVDVDATGLVESRRALNAGGSQPPVSLLGLVARFALLALRRYPELNARVEQDEILIPDHVHLGFAAQTERGLVVPVVHDAHRLTTRELSAAMAASSAAARDGRLAPADLAGGTFTVNNYGVFGVDGSAAIINHPEVAILGLGRIIDRPWVVDGQVTARKVCELTLAFDHRVCDGGTAGGFLRYIADCIESPVCALGDL
jgi:pyruvate dehydrogenase E2 component (dihydrolipoamide acetyltransferase)